MFDKQPDKQPVFCYLLNTVYGAIHRTNTEIHDIK